MGAKLIDIFIRDISHIVHQIGIGKGVQVDWILSQWFDSKRCLHAVRTYRELLLKANNQRQLVPGVIIIIKMKEVELLSRGWIEPDVVWNVRRRFQVVE